MSKLLAAVTINKHAQHDRLPFLFNPGGIPATLHPVRSVGMRRQIPRENRHNHASRTHSVILIGCLRVSFIAKSLVNPIFDFRQSKETIAIALRQNGDGRDIKQSKTFRDVQPASSPTWQRRKRIRYASISQTRTTHSHTSTMETNR